mgnify:CR=1 FL=1
MILFEIDKFACIRLSFFQTSSPDWPRSEKSDRLHCNFNISYANHSFMMAKLCFLTWAGHPSREARTEHQLPDTHIRSTQVKLMILFEIDKFACIRLSFFQTSSPEWPRSEKKCPVT